MTFKGPFQLKRFHNSMRSGTIPQRSMTLIADISWKHTKLSPCSRIGPETSRVTLLVISVLALEPKCPESPLELQILSALGLDLWKPELSTN